MNKPSCSRNKAADARRSVLHRLVHQEALDLVEAVGILNGVADLGEMVLGADEFAVEQPVHELGRKLVSARDQVDETRSDHDPGPVGHVDVVVDLFDLLVEEEDRHAEQKAEGGRPAKRDPDVDHRLPPHRLDDEQAQDPVDEGERAGCFLRRLTSSEQIAEQRGLLRELGEQIGRKADQAAPDHPADALIVAGREIPPAPDQDRERARR